MSRPTDHSRLDLRQLHLDVVRGTSDGKIIWQPRIGCWLTDKRFAGVPLPEPYERMTVPGIYRALNCSPRIYEFNACFRRIEDSRVIRNERKLSETDTEITIHTPVGKQASIQRITSSSPHRIQVKREIESEAEMKVALWRAEHSTWMWDQTRYEALCAEWGNLGAPTMFMPRVNVQDLYINTMGVEKATYALYDWPDTVGAYFDALDQSHARLIRVINASPIEVINFGDNLHGGTLPPDLYHRYVLPSYLRRSEQLHAGGKFVHSHWDGDTKSLLPFAKISGLDGIEAITPKPQGDVTLEEVKEALGDEIFLIDGLPAILFDTLYPVSMLEEFTYRLIELFAPRLILGISDEISSTGDIERLRVVGRIVDEYNASCQVSGE